MSGHHDNEDLFQDAEVEITDLDPQTGPVRPRRFALFRLTPRQRRASLALTTGLFLLICILLLASIPDVRSLLLRTFANPAQTQTAGGLRLYLESNPSWGQFQLDGVTLTHLPLAEHDAPLLLAGGLHRLVWHAEPFQARQCTLNVVNSSTLTGSCTKDKEVLLAYIDNSSVLLISFFASLQDLPATQRAGLIQQIHTALASYASSEVVYPGEVYAVSEQAIRAHPSLCPIVVRITLCYARATQTLLATLAIQEDTQTDASDPCALTQLCSFNHLDCRLLCPDLAAALSGEEADGWNVLATVRLLWSYSTLTGTEVASSQPDTALRGVPAYQLFSLHIERAGQDWRVAPFSSPVTSSYTDPLCSQAIQDTTELVNTLTTNNQSIGIELWSDQQTHLATGCLEAASPAPGVFATPTPTPAAQNPGTAYCLFRFGVVLAANTVAHKLWPYLPQADAYEQGIAQRLYSLLPG
jgi:hypothetical protein